MKNRNLRGNSGFIYAAVLILGALFILASGVSTFLSEGGNVDQGDSSNQASSTVSIVITSTATSSNLVASSTATSSITASSSDDVASSSASSTATSTD